MYHLVQQCLLIFALAAIVIGADAYGEVGVHTLQQTALAFARHSAQSGARLGQHQTRHRQLIAEIIGVELPEPSTEYVGSKGHSITILSYKLKMKYTANLQQFLCKNVVYFIFDRFST